MENSERNSLFSAFHGRKIAFSRPWFPSLGTENSIDYAKCPSPGTENSERNSLFSALHGRKIAFSRPWFPSLGTENNTILYRHPASDHGPLIMSVFYHNRTHHTLSLIATFSIFVVIRYCSLSTFQQIYAKQKINNRQQRMLKRAVVLPVKTLTGQNGGSRGTHSTAMMMDDLQSIASPHWQMWQFAPVTNSPHVNVRRVGIWSVVVYCYR